MLDTSTFSKDSSRLRIKLDDIPSYKILIIGDQGIGKTSLIHRYITGEFKESNQNIGLDFQEKTIQVSPNDKIALIIWDTAGSEKFHSIAQSFFTNCDGIILCFDTTDIKTFENLNNWVDYINDYIDIKDNNYDGSTEKNIKKKSKDEEDDEEEEEENEEEKEWIDDEQFKPSLVLTGTKSDLRENQVVLMEDIKNFTKNLKCEYFETSAKNGNGVEDLFFYMAKDLFEKKIVVNKSKKGFKLGMDKSGYEGESKSNAECC